MRMLALLALAPVAALAATPQRWDFTVFLDKREIGTHTFVVTDEGDTRKVESNARLRVKILGISAYAYDHTDSENWKGGCLQQISSRTNSDGKPFEVSGQIAGAVLQVKTLVGTSTLSGCISTFAYWDQRFLNNTRLLNSQTGEHVAVKISDLGNGRWRITGDKMDITLVYERGEWQSLQSVVEGGRTLRYVRKQGPQR